MDNNTEAVAAPSDQQQSDHPTPSDSTTTASSSSIWHTGTPAEAISSAITQQKLFLVWISPCEPSAPSEPSEPSEPSADPQTVPASWDTLWSNAEVKAKVLEHAVCLRMTQGTTDAAMFLQLVGFPAQATGLWIVFAGRLLDSVESSEPPEVQELLRRIQAAIGKAEEIKAQPVPVTAPPASVPAPVPVSRPATSSAVGQSAQGSQESQSPEIQSQLAARRAKMEAAKKQHGPFLVPLPHPAPCIPCPLSPVAPVPLPPPCFNNRD